MIDFDKIVNKLLRKWWKVFFKEDIFEIIDPDKEPRYQITLDKTIYKLKAKWIIISIKAGVYIVPSEEDLKLNEVDLIEKYYLYLLKKYITYYAWSDYYISWKKSLEIHLKDFSIPNKIYIVNRWVNKKLKIGNNEIIFKTISSTEKWKKINLYSKLSDFVITKDVYDMEFKVSTLELALLESALVSDVEEWVDLALLSKTIKKYSKVLNTESFYMLGKMKYIMSFNRLKEISKTIDKNLYEVFLDIIKKNWWLFIGEWLRKI